MELTPCLPCKHGILCIYGVHQTRHCRLSLNGVPPLPDGLVGRLNSAHAQALCDAHSGHAQLADKGAEFAELPAE